MVPNNSLSDTHASATHSGFLVSVSPAEQEPSGDAVLQTNPTNVSGTQSSAFSLQNLLLPGPDDRRLESFVRAVTLLSSI